MRKHYKIMRNAFLMAFGVLILGFAACSKDDKNEPEPPVEEPPTSTEIISATWNIDTIGIDTDANGSIDMALPFPLDACDRDNTLRFAADSTGAYSEGATKCSASDPDSIPFEWYFKNEDKVINLTGDVENLQGDIDVLTLNDSALVLSNELVLPPPYPAGTKLIVGLKK